MSPPKLRRPPQMAFRLDAAPPDPAERWRDGAKIAYLGRELHLHLGTPDNNAGKIAQQEGGILYLPLPPQATPRQIQDSAEAWLRKQGQDFLRELIAQESALAGRQAPALALSFATQGHWIVAEDATTLRCNWRLIEQSPQTIAQVLRRALADVAQLARQPAEVDLFGALVA